MAIRSFFPPAAARRRLGGMAALALAWLVAGSWSRAAEPPPARAQLIEQRSQLQPGPWAQGCFGDWLLANGRIAVIVAGTQSRAPSPLPAGTIVDAVHCDDPFDELGGIRPVVYRGDDKALDLEMASAFVEEAKPGWPGPRLVFEGRVAEMAQLRARTEFAFAEDPHVLRLTTSIVNESTTATLYNVGLGDRADWALLVPFIERFGLPDPSKVEATYSGWVGARMDNNSVGIVVPSDWIEALHLGAVSHLRYQTVYELRPGQSVSQTRDLFVAGRDFSRFTDYALQRRYKPNGILSGQVVEVDGKTPVPGIEMAVSVYKRTESFDAGTTAPVSTAQTPYTIALTDEAGEYSARVPVGRAFALPKDPFRTSFPVALGYAISAGAESAAGPVPVSARTSLSLRVTDAKTGRLLPCKVQLQPSGEGRPVQYGPANQASGARHCWDLATGEETIPFPRQGRYQLRISRGVEYTTHEAIVVARAGQNIRYEAALERVVQTPGYVAVDFGVQTSASPNCRVSARDAVVAAASEGVEWLVTGDLNQATDLRPAIEAASLSGWLGATPGMRVVPWTRDVPAHFLVLPVRSLAPGQRFEADYLETGGVAAILRRLRGDFPQALLAVNTPWAVTEGYFRAYDIDLRTCAIPSSEFCYDFDLLGVLNGRQFLTSMQDRLIYNGMLLRGRNYRPIGGSSSQEIFGNEPGYPRTYVGVPNDDPSAVSEEQILEGLRQGDVVVTNGPFVRLRVEGKKPGELAQARNQRVDVELEVWAAPWMEIGQVEIQKDTLFHRQMLRPAVQTPLRFPLADHNERNPIRIEVLSDVSLQVLVMGRWGPMQVIPSIGGRASLDFPTFALTGPVFIDGDGDGKFSPPPDGQPRY